MNLNHRPAAEIVSPSALPPDTAASADGSTRARILAAALRVFAERGFEAATLKEITTASQTNVAAIHYHFGSKDVLIGEVLVSVSNPVNRLRTELLEAAQACPEGAQGVAPGRLEQVVHALVAPPIRLSFEATGDSRLLTRLLLQARVLPNALTSNTIFAQYDTTAQMFVDALQQATPGLASQEAYWRYAFAIGAMHYIVTESDAHNHRLQRISGGQCNTDDPDTIIGQLVAFVVAGLRAPAPQPLG